MLIKLIKYLASKLSFYCFFCVKKNKKKFNYNFLNLKIKKYKHEVLKTHSKLIYVILDLINKKKLGNFLRNQYIQNIFFIHNRIFILKELRELQKDKNWNLWKKILKENDIGNPIRYFLYCRSSGNRIRQVYILKKIVDILKINLKKINKIVEIGGGYGCLVSIISKINPKINYTVLDLFEVNLLQYFYLKMNNIHPSLNSSKERVTLTNKINIVKKNIFTSKNFLFIANWSLSEFPIKLRKKIEPIINKSKYAIISFQNKFENIDNIKYFKNLIKKFKNKFIVTIIPYEHYNASFLNQSNHQLLVLRKK